MTDGEDVVLEIGSEDSDDVGALYAALRGVRGIRLDAAPAPMEAGEQGTALDLLTVALSGGAVTAFLQIVRTVLDSRGPGFVLKVRRGRERLEITAASVEEVLPALRELLGGPS